MGAIKTPVCEVILRAWYQGGSYRTQSSLNLVLCFAKLWDIVKHILQREMIY